MSVKIFALKLGINVCYIVKDKGTIMIDAGPPEKIKKIKSFLKLHSIEPDEIKLIIATHGDFDHIGSAKELKELTGAKIAIHKNDKSHLEESIYNFPPGANSWGRFNHFILNAPLKKIMKMQVVKADIVLGDEDFDLESYGIDGKILYTPGHTSGSVSVLLKTGDAFVGCLAHNSFPFRFSPGLPIFAEDIELIKKSWQLLFEQGVTMVYPGHGKPFPVEVIKKLTV
jgi:hydroxyacylglutathione hydrolase